MQHLIDERTQREIAARIDLAVAEVLSELPNHGSEEGMTPVLGHALMKQSFDSPTLSVEFNYRQLNKITEEPHAGADGGIVVRIKNPNGITVKAALFQAKLLKKGGTVRHLSMSTEEAKRLTGQTSDMLAFTEEAVSIFYTPKEIYVVDANKYQESPTRHPLSTKHRLLSLGTYLGRWMPRCTRGDLKPELISRVMHHNGFKQHLTMDIITSQLPILWKDEVTPSQTRRRRQE